MKNRIADAPSRTPSPINIFDEYKDEIRKNFEEIVITYDDKVTLIKKAFLAFSPGVTSGISPGRSRFGSKKESHPLVNKDGSIYLIPAIVELNAWEQRKKLYGVSTTSTGMVHFSVKWLEEQKVTLEPEEDKIVIYNNSYRITSFSDASAVYTRSTSNFLFTVGVA